ncbi:MAG: phosphoribosyltransferase family protein [Comamonas sp.]
MPEDRATMPPPPAQPAPGLRAHVAHAAGVLGLLALPARCRICHGWPAQTLCVDCTACFADTARRCPHCALPLAPAAPSGPCAACQRRPPALDWALTRQDYAYPWSGLLARLKFGNDLGLARALGRHMAATPGLAERLTSVDVVIPLPLSRQRLAERGFNQSAALARALLSAATLARPPALRPGWLEKHRDTPPQHGLSHAQRQANARGAYRVPAARAHQLPGSRILLVDDVMTTGASLGAAAAALKRAGAREVGAVVLARA